MHACRACSCYTTHVSENNLQELVLTYYVSPNCWTQVTRVGRNYVYLRGHLSVPGSAFKGHGTHAWVATEVLQCLTHLNQTCPFPFYIDSHSLSHLASAYGWTTLFQVRSWPVRSGAVREQKALGLGGLTVIDSLVQKERESAFPGCESGPLCSLPPLSHSLLDEVEWWLWKHASWKRTHVSCTSHSHSQSSYVSSSLASLATLAMGWRQWKKQKNP